MVTVTVAVGTTGARFVIVTIVQVSPMDSVGSMTEPVAGGKVPSRAGNR